MAGSFSHVVNTRGDFTMSLIENMGDAHEALKEAYFVIAELCDGDLDTANAALTSLGFPSIDAVEFSGRAAQEVGE